MRVATGLGQIETRPVNITGGAPLVLEALLFNFDIDDATVKQQHRDWLDANIVASFRNSPSDEVLLQGTASQSGASDYNLGLSRRRVEAVQNYLIQRGVPRGQIETSWTGQQLSTSTSKEDPHDRAVKVLLESARLPSERFLASRPLSGFEPSTSPTRMDSLIVTAGDTKAVNLSNPAIVGQLVMHNPAIATVNPVRPPIPPTLKLFGLAPGITVLEAWDASHTMLLAELEVVVKPALVKSMAFHIVIDGATPSHRSDRTIGGIRQLFETLTPINLPQTGISFTWDGSLHIIRTSADLGTPWRLSTPDDRFHGVGWEDISSQADQSADIRVYFVHDVDLVNTERDEFGAGVPSGDLIMGDDTPTAYETKTLAHETGHCFNLDHADPADQLMSISRVLPPGLRIERKEADIVNPGVAGPSPRPRLRRR